MATVYTVVVGGGVAFADRVDTVKRVHAQPAPPMWRQTTIGPCLPTGDRPLRTRGTGAVPRSHFYRWVAMCRRAASDMAPGLTQ